MCVAHIVLFVAGTTQVGSGELSSQVTTHAFPDPTFKGMHHGLHRADTHILKPLE